MSSTIELKQSIIDPVQSDGLGVPRCMNAASLERPSVQFGSKRIISIPAISGLTLSDASSSSTILQTSFGPGAGFMVANSAYLKVKITNDSTAGAYGWACSPVGGPESIISRITVSQGGNILSQINNFSFWMGGVAKPYLTNAGFSNVSALYQYNLGQNNFLSKTLADAANSTSSLTTVPNTSFSGAAAYAQPTVIIPLPVSVLASTDQQYLPLSMLSAPVQIEIVYQNLNNALYGDAAFNATKFGVDTATLCYEVVDPDSAYVNATRAALMQGGKWNMACSDVLSVNFGASSSTNYTLGVSLSSVNAVFVGTVIAENWNDKARSKYFTSASGATVATDPTAITQRNLYVDGTPVWSLANVVNTDSQLFVELLRAISQNVSNAEYSIPFSSEGRWDAQGTFKNGFYLRGYNLRNVSENNMIFTGRPVKVLNIVEQDSNLKTTDQMFVFVIHDTLCSLTGDGMFQVLK